MVTSGSKRAWLAALLATFLFLAPSAWEDETAWTVQDAIAEEGAPEEKAVAEEAEAVAEEAEGEGEDEEAEDDEAEDEAEDDGHGEDCLDCHDDIAHSSPVHEDFACTDCHANIEKKDGHPHDDDILGKDWKSSVCGDCHEDANAEFHASIHGAIADDVPKDLRPYCTSCHGDIHALVASTDEHSPLFPTKIASTCAACHANAEWASRGGLKLVQPVAAYEASVHGRAVMRGEKGATCTACHGSHDIRPASDAKSQVARKDVPAMCGTCHEEIAAKFAESVHGRAAAKGITDSPICTDCHGEHRILEPERPDSPVFASNVPKMTCGRCHGDLRLAQKYGLAETNVASYEDSFHGLAGRAGQATVANCSSCHGVHDILPSTDPRSHVHKDNLAETCGTCHPGAGSSFAIGAVHIIESDKETTHPAVYWARIVYLWLIVVTIGGMLVHNALDLYRKANSHLVRPVVRVRDRRVRLPLPFRLAHGTLAISFIVLAVTGFALKYPEAGWVQPLLAWESVFGLRGTLHRVAACTMLAAFAFHFVHLIVDAKARACMLGMIPSIHDLVEVREKFRWFLGSRKDMPKSPTIGYVEKLEYLALVWGTLVMAVTGFALWFSNWSLANLPKWVADLATVVHFYEAVLATLAIIVWHLYSVIFDPLVYPMDMAWLTGREAPGRTLERSEDEEGKHGS